MDQSRWSLETIDLEHRTRAKVWSEDTKREMEAFKKRLATDDDFYERHYGVPRTKEKPMQDRETEQIRAGEGTHGAALRPRDTPDQPAGRLVAIAQHVEQAGMMAENLGERLGEVRNRILGAEPPGEIERAGKRPEEVLPGLDEIDRGMEILEARMQTLLRHLIALEGL